jgi:16S rRNA (guanine966-N2)-methyltransferase
VLALANMRITGGVFRSRALVAPHGARTRPTADRVREALFSMLSGRFALEDSVVLDLYSGTGALAFEALSRGARRAICVEQDREALKALRRNSEALGVVASVSIVNASVEGWARRAPRASSASASTSAAGELIDLVFADPPYRDVASGALTQALSLVARQFAANMPTLWVVEHASKDAAPAVHELTCSDTRRYGDTAISFYVPKDLRANSDESQ